MNTRLYILWIAVACVACAALTPAWLSARRAAHAADAAVTQLEQTKALAGTLASLGSGLPAWAREGAAAADDQTVAKSMTQSLADAGVPTSALASLSPASVTPLSAAANLPASSRPVRVRHSAALEPVTLKQLGGVLEQWRSARPNWTAAAIDIAPARVEPGSKAARAGTPLRVSLTVETVRPAPQGKP